MNAPIRALLTPQGIRRGLCALASQMPAADPLSRLLTLLEKADLSCAFDLRASDFDAAEMALDELPGVFDEVLDVMKDAFQAAKE